MKRHKVTLQQRLGYHFDNMVSRGTPALIAALGFMFAITALFTAVVLYFSGIEEVDGRPLDVWESYWVSLMHVIDQGTITGDTDWPIRLTMLSATLMGIFLVSSLVSILNQGFSTKIEELKKGRSLVLEHDHTVILGWSNKIFTIISELVIANENQSYSCIVVLADENVDTMKDEISRKVGKTGKTKVIYRQGNPRDPDDIIIANLNTAKSIIVMSPDDQKSDSYVIKTIMAIVNNPNRKSEKYNIIAEIADEVNKDIARIIGKDEVTFVISNDVISKIVVQTSRQSGLSHIYYDLINYNGVELYILPVKNIAGHTFGEALYAFDDVTVIGIRDEKGNIKLNPMPDTKIGVRDLLIVIAEDDMELEFDKSRKTSLLPVPETLLNKVPNQKKKQKTLILGWNKNIKIILKELDNYVEEGSLAHICAEEEEMQQQVLEIDKRTPNQRITCTHGDINDRNTLNELHPEDYDYIIILSYSDKHGVQEADAISLITLMHVRDIAEKQGKTFKIVSEILDVKNRTLANISKADDFIISDEIISLILAQLSENKELSTIFEDMFDADGVEIYLKPVSGYLVAGSSSDFNQIIHVASKRNEIAIGYFLDRYGLDKDKNFGAVLNPRKSEIIEFEEKDRVIVLAEN